MRIHEEFTSEEVRGLPIMVASALKAVRCVKCNKIVYCNDKEMETCMACKSLANFSIR